MLQTSALPLGYVAKSKWSGRRDSNSRPSPWQGDALPLSHSRKWCPEAESNHRHEDFQSSALPTELSGQERVMGIEPTYSAWKADILPLNYTRISRPQSQGHERYSIRCPGFCQGEISGICRANLRLKVFSGIPASLLPLPDRLICSYPKCISFRASRYPAISASL